MDPNRWANCSALQFITRSPQSPVATIFISSRSTIRKLDARTVPPAYYNPKRPFCACLGEPCGHHGEDDVGDVWVIGLLPDCTPFNQTVRPPPLNDRVGTVGATMR